MSAATRSPRGPVAGVAIIALTLVGTLLRIRFVDMSYITIVAAPATAAVFLLAGVIGLMEFTARPLDALDALTGPIACSYLLARRGLARLMFVEHANTVDLSDDPNTRSLLWALVVIGVGGYFITMVTMAARLGWNVRWRVAYLLAIGSLAAVVLLLDSGGGSFASWMMQVGSANPVCVWLFIACVYALVSAATLARAPRDEDCVARLRFAGGLNSVVGLVIVVSTLLHVFPATPLTSGCFAALGAAVSGAGIIAWMGAEEGAGAMDGGAPPPKTRNT